MAPAARQAGVIEAGRLDDAFYEARMSPLRFKLRKLLMAELHREMPLLVAVESSVSSPAVTNFFKHSALLGTYTFFLTVLPLVFWWNPSLGQDLLGVSGAGVYLTGAIKDYVAVPRPLCPPLRRRISLGSHHEEYGMPSTHSANAVAMALVLFKAWARATGEPDTWRDLLLAVVVPLSLILYAASVVIGRVVCGMHSIQDIAAGSLLGWLIFVGNEGVRHAFSDCSPWVSRLLALPVVVAAAKLHPEPIEACPCIDDSISFAAVIGGVTFAQSFLKEDIRPSTPGSFDSLRGVTIFVLAATVKVTVGITCVLLYRLAAKRALAAVRPANDADDASEQVHLNPVPSLVDLPAAAATGQDADLGRELLRGDMKRRHLASPRPASLTPSAAPTPKPNLYHNKVDVLSKIVVYAGIGATATVLVPLAFPYLGLTAT